MPSNDFTAVPRWGQYKKRSGACCHGCIRETQSRIRDALFGQKPQSVMAPHHYQTCPDVRFRSIHYCPIVCMMRECSRANLVPPEKASERYGVLMSGYLPQNSNPSRLGKSARDSSKIAGLLIVDYPLPKQGSDTRDRQQFSGLLDSSRWHASSPLSLLYNSGP